MNFKELCESVGGEWIDNSCEIKDVDEATDKVLDCVRDLNDKSSIDEDFSGFWAIEPCIEKVFDKMPISNPNVIDKIKEEAEKWIADAKIDADGIVKFWDEDVWFVTPYEHPAGFKLVWVSTDPWRGFYEVKASKQWRRLFEDAFYFAEDRSARLDKFVKELEEKLNEIGVPWATVSSRTSNVLVSGFDFFVDANAFKKKRREIMKIVRDLAEKYSVDVDVR